MDSRGIDGRLRRSCSTFVLGCSHLRVVREGNEGESGIVRDIWP